MKLRYIGVVVTFLIAGGGATGEAAVETVRQGADGFTVRIHVPEARETVVDLPQGSYLQFDIPDYLLPGSESVGKPMLPTRGFPFSIPDGMTATVTGVRVLATESRKGAPPVPVPHRTIQEVGLLPVEEEEYLPDPSVYGGTARYPRDLVTLGPVMGWRFHRVQSLVVSPISVLPREGSYEIARDLEVDVAFTPEPGARARVGPRDEPVREDAPGWDLFFDGALVNASSAASFRRRPVLEPADLPVEPGQTLVRVRVGESGPCRLTYEDLSAAGFPAGIPIGEVRVEERGYTSGSNPYTVVNLPRRVEDDGDGIFGPGDRVLFYGFNVEGRFAPPPHEARYGYFHSYWVTHSAAGGAEFTSTDGYPAGSYTLQDRFRDVLRLDESAFYVNNPQDTGSLFFPTSLGLYWLDSNDVDVLVRGDSYFSNKPANQGGMVWKPMAQPFRLQDVAPGGTTRLTAEWHGRNTVTATRDHFVGLELNGVPILTDSLFSDLHSLTYVSPVLGSDSVLVTGDNEMKVLGHSNVPTLTGAAFDYIEVAYDRGLRASGDLIVVNVPVNLGPVEYPLTGFTSPDIVVLDITSPTAPVILTGLATGGPGNYGISLRITSSSSPRTLAAFVPASHDGLPAPIHPLPPDLGPAPLATGLGRDLVAAGAGSDYILITHPSFRDGWQPLIDLREDEGHHVFLCDVHEIYDQFAGGDKTPWAIQRFLAAAFQTWDPAPSYVLLGGDANEDYRTDTGESDPDWVPTMMHIANVPGTAGRELAGTDNWYVAFLRPTDPTFDVLPEMHVGRLPVGSPEDVQAVVQKLVTYAAMSDQDDWRRRGVFLADDQYSTSLNFSSGYCWRAQELVFRSTTEAVCDSIAQVARLASFTCDTLFLNAYLDTVDALLRNPGDPNDCPSRGQISLLGETSRYARDHVTPILIDKLNRGCFIWEYTGHANKALITTEQIIQSRRGLSPDDVTRINNLGKPFVFYGYACHLAEFEDAKVLNRVSGDAIGESLLLAPNRGAIATIASTGYEWLYTNPDAQLRTSRYIFWDLPRDPATGRPRRILGEAHTWSFGSLVLNAPSSTDRIGMMRTYIHLGDPALKLDIQSASFLVDVDGAPWTDGTGLIAGSLQDSLDIHVEVSDDVDVATFRVRDGGTTLPPERLTVTPPGSRDRGLQTYEANFKTTLRVDNYDLVIEAEDWLHRPSQITFPVRFDVTFSADGNGIPSGGSVDPQSDLQVEVLSPVGLAAPDLELWVDGANRGETFVPQADTTGRRWVAVAGGPWGDGPHWAEVRGAGTGVVLRRLDFTVGGGALAIYRTYAYPNPYEDPNPSPENPLYFVYELSRNGDRAEVQIFTVKGRRVLRRDLPAFTNRNAFRWDLRDEAGDRVANGVYLFRLSVFGEDGTRLDRLERVAVSR